MLPHTRMQKLLSTVVYYCKPDAIPAYVLHVSFFRDDAVIAIGWTDPDLRAIKDMAG